MPEFYHMVKFGAELMNKKSDNRRNRPPQYYTKFRNLILDYLRKNQSIRVSITDLEKIKDEDGIHINRQTVRNNLRALNKSGDIKLYLLLNPSIENNKLPLDVEIFIELQIPSIIDGHPQLLFKLVSQLGSDKQTINKNSAELIQLFVSRVQTNLSIDAAVHEKHLQHYKQYLEHETYINSKNKMVNYSKKDIKKLLGMYEKENKKETYESALQNAEIEAKKLVDFLVHDATEEFKRIVANQLSTPNKDGKYDLNFNYIIYKN